MIAVWKRKKPSGNKCVSTSVALQRRTWPTMIIVIVLCQVCDQKQCLGFTFEQERISDMQIPSCGPWDQEINFSTLLCKEFAQSVAQSKFFIVVSWYFNTLTTPKQTTKDGSRGGLNAETVNKLTWHFKYSMYREEWIAASMWWCLTQRWKMSGSKCLIPSIAQECIFLKRIFSTRITAGRQLLCLNSGPASFWGAFDYAGRMPSQSEGSTKCGLLSLFLEDEPLLSFVASHIPRFFACPKKRKEGEKMVTSCGVDRHLPHWPVQQKSWRRG